MNESARIHRTQRVRGVADEGAAPAFGEGRMRSVVILVASALVACGGYVEETAGPTYYVAPRQTEVDMVVRVPCVRPPCAGAAPAQPPAAAVMRGRPAPIQLALGWDHSCALTVDGAVWCWGSNGHHQLGEIGSDQSAVPARVPSLPAMTAIWAGANQTCGSARDDGQLWCWGETGLGPTRERGFALPLPFTNVRTVSLAYRKGCFITAEGALYCWGNFGIPHGPNWAAPRRVPAEGVIALRGGTNRFCALNTRGQVSCFGMRLAYAVTEPANEPLWRLPDLRDVSLFTFDDFAPHPPFWIVDRHGRVFEATPRGGRPNRRHSGEYHFVFNAAEGLSHVVELVSSGGHQCARTSSGTAACWGSNSSGQVGDGTTASRAEPRALNLTNVEQIAVGKAHTCARAHGTIYCWGSNRHGQVAVEGRVHEVLEPREVPW